MEAIKGQLTNLQLQLLRTFSHQLTDEDLKELKSLLVDFFAKRAIEGADKVWDKESWDENKVKELLNTKMRTPYKK